MRPMRPAVSGWSCVRDATSGSGAASLVRRYSLPATVPIWLARQRWSSASRASANARRGSRAPGEPPFGPSASTRKSRVEKCHLTVRPAAGLQLHNSGGYSVRQFPREMGRCVKESAIPVQRHEDKWGIGSGYQKINCRMINDSRHVTRVSADERLIQLERPSGTAQRSPAFEVPIVFGVAVPFVLRVPRIGAHRPAASLKRLAGRNYGHRNSSLLHPVDHRT